MAKLKTVYVCTGCGFEHPKWSGQCTNCGQWNTLTEDVIDKSEQKIQQGAIRAIGARKLSEVEHVNWARLETGISELDRVLGGGIVPGSVILLGGEPGIGKSTITLQVIDNLKSLQNVYYVAGEESAEQIALRAKRMGVNLENTYFLETNIYEEMIAAINEKPDLLILDSIQVIRSAASGSIPGGMTQIRIVTDKIVEYAKSKNVPVILIGHVTKDGELAGPKVLEHMVDTVLYLEGDRYGRFRFLKSVKNRFGATDEVGIFQMEGSGLIPVADPAAEFRETRDSLVIGSALTCMTEGNRPIIVEMQALTTPSNYGYPKRSSTGFDANRLAMIIAVLQKYYGVDLSGHDVFVNVSGGFKIKDTAADLAVMKALVSSYKKEPLRHDKVYIGEVSLSGQVRRVSYQDLREAEIKRLGFEVELRAEGA